MNNIAQDPAIIVWFRQDLRISDQAALHAASQTAAPIIPLFILDDKSDVKWGMGSASLWWLEGSLIELNIALKSINSRLILRRGRPKDVLDNLLDQIVDDYQTNSLIDAAYTRHTVTTPGTTSWTVPAGVTSVDYLVVAGGGSAAFSKAGGGGAGGMLTNFGGSALSPSIWINAYFILGCLLWGVAHLEKLEDSP